MSMKATGSGELQLTVPKSLDFLSLTPLHEDTPASWHVEYSITVALSQRGLSYTMDGNVTALPCLRS